GDAGLALESRGELWRATEQLFHRDRPADAQIACGEHAAHAAAPDLETELVRTGIDARQRRVVAAAIRDRRQRLGDLAAVGAAREVAIEEVLSGRVDR